VISLHGGGGNKADIDREVVARVNERGITVVTIDAYLHGQRAPEGFDISAPGTFRQALFLDGIEHTARDLFAVVEFLGQDPAIAFRSIGLRGGSMGGYIVLASVGMGVSVHAVLSICGAADYSHTFPQRLEPDEPSTQTPAEHEALLSRVREIDPIFHPERFPPRPVLLIHGDRDTVVPISGDRALYEALVPLYAEAPQDCLFLIHAGGHATPDSLERLGWEWLAPQLFRAGDR